MNYLNNKTRWVIKINDLKNKRVLIEYLPLENKFIFSGQFKILEIWYNFSKKEIVLSKLITGIDENENYIYNDINVNNIDIDENIILVYNELEDKLSNYVIFSERMEEYRDSINNKNFSCKITDESEISN